MAFYLFINFLSTVASVGEISIVELHRTGLRSVLRPLKWRHSQALSSADNGLQFIEIEQNPHDDDNEAREHICWGLWRVTAAGGHTYRNFVIYLFRMSFACPPWTVESDNLDYICCALGFRLGWEHSGSVHTHTRQYLFVSFGHKTIENSLHSWNEQIRRRKLFLLFLCTNIFQRRQRHFTNVWMSEPEHINFQRP